MVGTQVHDVRIAIFREGDLRMLAADYGTKEEGIVGGALRACLLRLSPAASICSTTPYMFPELGTRPVPTTSIIICMKILAKT